jgi:hypothetical protein
VRRILLEFRGQKLCKLTSWLVLAYIAYVTLSPIKQRPILAGVQFEHFAAFTLLGTAFALSYQRQIGLALAIVIGSAFGLEALQLITPDRHGRMIDALAKGSGRPMRTGRRSVDDSGSAGLARAIEEAITIHGDHEVNQVQDDSAQ